MADLRIFSYLPNPRLFKATIAARFSGAEIEIVGTSPKELPNWLWDYQARPLQEPEKSSYASVKREAKKGFAGALYKTDAFLVANPFGDIPAAFGRDGQVGIFESNSIMRAAARLGPNAPQLLGKGPLEQSRIDGFLDRTLVFARDMQRYLLARQALTKSLHGEMAASLASYLGGIEQALGTTKYVADDEMSLADIAFACEVCLLCNEASMTDTLEELGLPPLLGQLAGYERVRAHLEHLSDEPRFSEDLAGYFEKLNTLGKS